MFTYLECAKYAFVAAANVLAQRTKRSPECIQMPEDLK